MNEETCEKCKYGPGEKCLKVRRCDHSCTIGVYLWGPKIEKEGDKMKEIPIDVMRDIAIRAVDFKNKAIKCREDAQILNIKATLFESEHGNLINLLDKWQTCFPDTSKEY